VNGQTDAAGADGAASPLELSGTGETFVQSLGSNAAAGALETVTPQVGDLGASFAQGALGQLSDTLQPSLPYIIVGVAIILFLGLRR
jgi:hypothetical protein